MPRPVRTMLACAVLFASVTAPAGASTATYSGGVLTLTGAGTENNTFTIELTALGGHVPAVVVRDAGVTTMTPSPECLPIALNALACPGGRPTRVRAVLGAGNDDMRLSAAVQDVPHDFDGGPGDDRLQGSTKDDVFRPGSGADTMTGAEGDDVLDLRGETAAVIADAAAGTATFAGATDQFDGIERIESGAGNDDLSGFAVAFGGSGDDVMRAGPEGSFLDGGPGSDVLIGALGARDSLFCGLGRDTAVADDSDHVEDCEVVG